MISGAQVVAATEGATDLRAGLLEQNKHDHDGRQDDLNIRQD